MCKPCSWSVLGFEPALPVKGGSGRVPGGSKRLCHTEVTKYMATEGYCVKCKSKKEMKDPEAIVMKNGRPATKGTCPDCGTGMYKIGATK